MAHINLLGILLQDFTALLPQNGQDKEEQEMMFDIEVIVITFTAKARGCGDQTRPASVLGDGYRCGPLPDPDTDKGS